MSRVEAMPVTTLGSMFTPWSVIPLGIIACLGSTGPRSSLPRFVIAATILGVVCWSRSLGSSTEPRAVFNMSREVRQVVSVRTPVYPSLRRTGFAIQCRAALSMWLPVLTGRRISGDHPTVLTDCAIGSLRRRCCRTAHYQETPITGATRFSPWSQWCGYSSPRPVSSATSRGCSSTRGDGLRG